MQTKICTRKTCKHRGQPQPISNFGKSKNCSDGFHPWCKDCRKDYNKENKSKIKKYNHDYKASHVEEIQEYEKKKGIYEYRRQFSKAYKQESGKFDVFDSQINYCEDTRRDPNNPELIQCKCAVCKQWFNPTASQLHNRISALCGKKKGEAKLYCSEKCKKNCGVYRQRVRRANEIPPNQRDRTLQFELKQMVAERDENCCQRCGVYIPDLKDLICHHLTGISRNPLESADVDNCVSLCKKCDDFIHSQPGCRRVDMRCNRNKVG